MSRILVNNTCVGEWVGETFVHETQAGNRKRTYVFSKDGLSVTVGGVTRQIALPWLTREEKAA